MSDLNNKLRQQYLYKLGFESSHVVDASRSPKMPQVPKRRQYSSHQEPLKGFSSTQYEEQDNAVDPVESASTPSSSPTSVLSTSLISLHSTPSTAGFLRKKKSVHFNESANIISIPNRGSYSRRMRDRLWLNPHEFIENLNRNASEFQFENYDWKQVVEEQDFSICPLTGRKIHPLHALNARCRYHNVLSSMGWSSTRL